MDLSNMLGFLAVVVALSTSLFTIRDLEFKGEVRGDVEGDLLSEWAMDLDLLAIHISCPPSSAKKIYASKITASTSGKTTRSGP